MELLYSNILPLGTMDNQKCIADVIVEEMRKADRIDIAVGYVSNSSLIELDELIVNSSIKNVSLVIGMYYVEGMPENSYHTAMRINENGAMLVSEKLESLNHLSITARRTAFTKTVSHSQQ